MLDPKRGQQNNLAAVWEILRQLEARQCQINIVCQTTTPLLLNDYLSLSKDQAYANICITTYNLVIKEIHKYHKIPKMSLTAAFE